MTTWGAIVGAFIGTLIAGIFGLVGGALLGALAGSWLRKLVREEIASAAEQLRPTYAFAAEPIQQPATTAPGAPAEAPVPAAPVWTSLKPTAAAQPEKPKLWGREAIEFEEWQAATAAHQLTGAAEPRYTGRTSIDFIAIARNWLMGGNTIVRTGLLILFLGLTFLASYAASIGLFPIEARLSLVAAVGAILVGVGFSRRIERPVFARALEGTGVAVLYLTVFASSRLYDLIPVIPAFGLMILFSALGCALALMQNSQPMAMAAFVGGFAVPVLLGGNSQQPMVPFSYYTMLNLTILVIAWRRPWRVLNLVGFVATFAMAWIWGLQNYQPWLYAICQFFLAASVLIYLATAVFYAHNTPGRFGNVVDGVLLFGPALAGFSLQVGLVRPYEFGSAYSSLAFGAVYIALAAAIVFWGKKTMRPLTDYLIGIGVGFVTLAIPLALSVRWTAAGWAIEGAAAFWIGTRQQHCLPRLFGSILQAVGAMVFLGSISQVVSSRPFFNGGFVGALLIGIPLIATAWWLRKPVTGSSPAFAPGYGAFERRLEKPFFLAGFAFLCLAFMLEITRSLPSPVASSASSPVFSLGLQRLLSLVAVLILMWGSAQRAQRNGWDVARWPARASVLALWLVFVLETRDHHHLLYAPSWLPWLVAIVLTIDLLFVSDRAIDAEDRGEAAQWMTAMHIGMVWFLAAMIADSLQLGVDRAALWRTSWSGVVYLLSGIAIVVGLTWWAGSAAARNQPRASRWPLKGRSEAFYWRAAVPVAGLVYFGAFLAALFASGVTDPLPYVPLLNPVDLSVGLALVALLLWRKVVLRANPALETQSLLEQRTAVAGGTVLAFVAVNGIWLRTAHHWLGVQWSISALTSSFVVQAGLAILWTLLAMALMLLAYKRLLRLMWGAGATLLVAVVLKLVLVDLSYVGRWERVVSYIAVGALMLVIGYFAPLPPRSREKKGAGATA